ncbi:unnamed protein product [Calicophoron daubneyi]|uniref:Ras-associating domain-containing protein n=1 Tax=Calicophoron daubneyi TaxID=300641 RepID=A0AAV2TP63_CALDB
MDVDLSELDDWLGTLEELQLGLEMSSSVTSGIPNPQDQSRGQSVPPQASSHLNRTFENEPPSPRNPPVLSPSSHVNLTATCSSSPTDSCSILPSPNASPSKSVVTSPVRLTSNPRLGDQLFRPPHQKIPEMLSQQNGDSVLTSTLRSNKEATAERDLSSLLRELEVVEERMKELEQENNFTRRYSLASATPLKRPIQTQNSMDGHLPYEHSSPKPENGFISAQWAAQLNQDRTNATKTPEKNPSPSPPPPPPAFLGAGDACASPSISPQPPTPSFASLKQTEAAIWSVTNCTRISSLATTSQPLKTNVTYPLHYPANRIDSTACINQNIHSTVSNQPVSCNEQVRPPATCYQNYENQEETMQQIEAIRANSRISASSTNKSGSTLTVENSSTPSTTLQIEPPERRGLTSPLSVQQPNKLFAHQGPALPDSELRLPSPSNLRHASPSGDDKSYTSGTGSWSPGAPVSNAAYIKTALMVTNGGSDGQSSSLSPGSSLSDKSFADSVDLSQKSNMARTSIERQSAKKLVVRIFRTDRTTKAILIREQMTAGEIASTMIEKNFLQPSTSMVIVEKVPALKIERIFEENDRVADCILSWPTGSQNMIFFEQREDHYGFIESPSMWLGEEFASTHRYDSSESMQMMLNNIEQSGFPEFRDFLYIRKPGDKTWSRRLCVLRSSGLYTSKKNRKNFSSSDLIRILVLDGQLQLYTTTGGWTRMRAPTPHGFAFKPYSAQDPASMHVFCFCATDEKALRHWICRLRIAKYGRQLFINYQTAVARIQRQIAFRHGPVGGVYGLNGSFSAYVQRKSSLEASAPSQPSCISAAESASSLPTGLGSPSSQRRKENERLKPQAFNRSQTAHSNLEQRLPLDQNRCLSPSTIDHSHYPGPLVDQRIVSSPGHNGSPSCQFGNKNTSGIPFPQITYRGQSACYPGGALPKNPHSSNCSAPPTMTYQPRFR